MSPALLLGVAFLTGAAVMVVELMGVRVMAPWFGQSQVVWTNVIGVVLASLACGQWLGGRWAESKRGFAPGSLLVVAGAMCIALPDAVDGIGAVVLPADLGLLDAYPFISAGSLLVALAALGLPMFALGAVTPWLVRLFRDAQEAPGAVAGRVLGIGTLGSLVGTFGSTHVLLEAVGSAMAVRLAGAVLVLSGLVVAASQRRSARLAATSLVVPLVLVLAVDSSSAARRDGVVLDSVESVYQWSTIEEQDDGLRLLRINEGLDSFHSAFRPGRLVTGLYFDAFVLPALAAPRGPDGRRSVLIIGMGAGTMARQIRGADPIAEIVGVEIDAELAALGSRWMELPPDVLVAAGVDGRMALRDAGRRYGAVLIDAYSQQVYLPHHLCTEEFFREVSSVLLPDGVAALNLSAVTREEPVVTALVGTLARVFPHVELARVPMSRNWIVLAWKSTPLAHAERARLLDGTPFGDACAWMTDAQAFAAGQPHDGRVLVDGNAPVEALADATWRGEE